MSTQGVKRKRCAYDAAFKLKVISAAEETNNSAAAREFGINEKQVRDWRKGKELLLTIPKTKCARRGKKPLYHLLEEDIKKWIEKQRECGYIVTYMQVRLRAQRLAKDDKYHVDPNFARLVSPIYAEKWPVSAATNQDIPETTLRP